MTNPHIADTGPSAPIAKRLYDARVAQDKSLATLAESTGIPRETLRRKVDKGVGELTMREASTLARELGLDLGELMREAVAS
jgi:DNA-binding phage protein